MTRTLPLLILLLASCAGRLPQGGPAIRVAVSESSILEIPLEEYVVGVLEGELPGEWPLEALKAQAVVSRTYALYQREKAGAAPYDVTSTTQDQVFRRSKKPSAELIQAVVDTRGEVLRFEANLIPAYFHSSCGGIGEKASLVWEGEFPAPLEQFHEDPYCEASPRTHWNYEATTEEIGGALQVLERDEGGRINLLLIQSEQGDQEISGNRFREKLGYDKIRSTLFDIDAAEGRIRFEGKGSGHGVGLCQWGAKGMAEQGYGYREILEFYYPGAELGHAPL